MSPRSTSEEDSLEGRLGYSFLHRELLTQALTHVSMGRGRDNQRLEFLGDGLLSLAVTELLFDEHPDWQEGPMSKLRSLLVGTEALAAWAQDLGLDRQLASHHPRKAPPMGPKPLADALEAVLAAVYLDARRAGAPPEAPVKALVRARFLDTIRATRPEALTQLDPKTHLQETAARLGLPAPAYTVVGQSGPGHAPRFTVRVAVGEVHAEAEGTSRKRAESAAASTLLEGLADSPVSGACSKLSRAPRPR
jgi:ribonuclease-3